VDGPLLDMYRLKNKTFIYFFSAYVSYPLMYIFENSNLFINYLFLIVFVSSSVLGFISLLKKWRISNIYLVSGH